MGDSIKQNANQVIWLATVKGLSQFSLEIPLILLHVGKHFGLLFCVKSFIANLSMHIC